MSTTPILDLEQEPPAPRVRRWPTVLYLVVGAGIGVALSEYDFAMPGFNILLWLPCVYMAITIHELGHLAAGRAFGLPPGGLIVGGFVLMKYGDRWRLRFDRRRIFGGGVALPAGGDFRVDAFAWMVAAGPAASILCTFACWVAFRKHGSGDWDWIGTCFWASAIGLLSAIPMSAGIHKSDAARLWMLCTRPEQARAWMAAVAVQAENNRGVRPREWNAALVTQMLAADQPTGGQVFPQLLAYYRALDEGNEEAAFQHVENALAASGQAGKPVRQALYLEATEANALLRKNAGNAKIWLERAIKLRKPECGDCAAGAVAICEGRFEDALADIGKTRKFLARMKVNSGLGLFAEERLDERERLCREAIAVGVGQ